MPERSVKAFLQRTTPVVIFCGVACMLLGLSVLVGWQSSNVRLIRVLPPFAPMHVNAAMGFVFCGAGLLLLRFGRPGAAMASGFLSVCVGVLTLLEHIYDMDLGVDQHLMRRFASPLPGLAGRMAPNTALCFGFVGGALAILGWSARPRRRLQIAGLLSSITVALGLVALFGYIGHVETAYGWGRLSRMAVHEAAGLALLASGLFLHVWGEGVREEVGTPRWLALPVGVWSATLSIALWQALVAARTQPPLPELVLLSGLAMAGLLALTVHLSHTNEIRSREVELVNDVLEAEVRERKKAEEALRQSNREVTRTLSELRHTQDSLVRQERLSTMGQMASGIAHDVNNALTIITGYCELMTNYPQHMSDPVKSAEGIKQIKLAAEDAASVVRRLQELYRRSDETKALFPLSLNQIVEEVIELTKPRWKGEALVRGATIEVGADLAEIPLVGSDKSAMREVLTNLVFNAVDAMPNGGQLTLATRTDDDSVYVDVRDTGSGMSEEVRCRCMEPFFSTKQGRGTGLGLSLCQTIIQRFNGSLEVASELGKGSTFTVRFPIHTDPTEPEGEPASVERNRPLHVLVVEDEEPVRTMLHELLTHDGHIVRSAASGQSALQIFEAAEFDIVITDNAMPGMLGEQLALALRRIHRTIPIVMLTGFADLMRSKGGTPEGVDTLVGKPVTLAALRTAIAEALGNRAVDLAAAKG